MTVTKSMCERYSILADGESATIGIVEWTPRRDAHGPIYGGEILVNSTFGSYCNSWSHCGQPFKDFLASLDFQYFMEKCRGIEATRFDGERTVRAMRDRILQLRGSTSISFDEARAAWDHLSENREKAEFSEREFVEVMFESPLERLRDEPWQYTSRSPVPETVSFWRTIWPEFVAAVKAEKAGTQ